MNPARELLAYLSAFADRCLKMRWLGALFHVRVLSNIATDIEARDAKIAADAYTTEQAALDASAKLAAVTADGFVTADEMPVLQAAIRTFNACAQRAHDTAEITA
jgi:hypothetical protein